MTAASHPAVPPPLLEIEGLRVGFDTPTGTAWAVDGVSLWARAGETLGVVGESGSGKSVTIKAVMGLLGHHGVTVQGKVRFDGVDLLGCTEAEMRRRRGCDIALVSQDPLRSLNPTMKVGAQIVEAIRLHTDITAKDARRRTLELLDAVRIAGAADRIDQYPYQMSGGMRQRVVIAMALSCRPRLLLADEPTTALDVTTQAGILDLIGDLQRDHEMGVILVTHDMGVVAGVADRVAVMYGGRIVEQADTRTLFRAMRMPYTSALLGAIPTIDATPHSMLATIPGRPPDQAQRPAGCSFHPRCARRGERCDEQVPELSGDADGHRWACWHPLDVAVEAGSGVRMVGRG